MASYTAQAVSPSPVPLTLVPGPASSPLNLPPSPTVRPPALVPASAPPSFQDGPGPVLPPINATAPSPTPSGTYSIISLFGCCYLLEELHVSISFRGDFVSASRHLIQDMMFLS